MDEQEMDLTSFLLLSLPITTPHPSHLLSPPLERKAVMWQITRPMSDQHGPRSSSPATFNVALGMSHALLVPCFCQQAVGL